MMTATKTIFHPKNIPIIIIIYFAAAVIISLANLIWSHHLVNHDLELHPRSNFFPSSSGGLRQRKNSESVEFRTSGLEHCPNSSLHALTDEKYPLPLVVPSKTSFVFRIPPQILRSNITVNGYMPPDHEQETSKLYLDVFFPGWKIISDDEESCFKKIQQFELFDVPEVKMWFFSGVTKQSHKRDLCMLAQLFVDGGIWLGFGYESQMTVLDKLTMGVDVISLVGIGNAQEGSFITQTVLAAPQGHPLVHRALSIACDVIFNGMKLTFPSNSLGFGVLSMALQETYISTAFSYKNMICKGVYFASFNIIEIETGEGKENNEIQAKEVFSSKAESPPDEKLWLLPRNNHPDITKTIPRLISKVYFQKDGQSMDNSTITDGLREALDSWTIMNLGYKVKFFNLITARKYLNEYFNPIFLRAFDCIEAFAAKADFFRLVVLYRDGGWYSDWKQACLKENLLEDISKGTDFFAIKDNGNNYSRDNECVSNAFIGATPRHPIIAKSIEVVLKNVQGNYYGPHALDATGPCAFGLGIKEAQEQHGLKYDTSDVDFREEPPYTYYVRNDENIILGKCADCGGNQDWNLGNNYVTLWNDRNYYCQDAASIFD